MRQPQKNADAARDFLAQLSSSDQAELYRIGKKQTFAKNAFIFKAGALDLNAWVVLRGRVKLFASSAHGRDILLWFTLAGDIFGLAECLQERPRLIDARAAETSQVLSISHAQLKEWLSVRPEVAQSLMKIMAERMRELSQRFLSLANGDIQMEIAQLLIRLGATHGKLAGGHIRMSLPLTVQDIADMVGSNRQGVSTCLAKMKRAGTIDINKHFLTIKRQEDLQQMALGLEAVVVPERKTCQRVWLGAQSGI